MSTAAQSMTCRRGPMRKIPERLFFSLPALFAMSQNYSDGWGSRRSCARSPFSPLPPLSSLLSRSHVGTEPVTARGADTVRRGRVETSRGILSPDAVLSQARDRGRGTGGEGQGERDRDHVRDAHEVGLPEASPLIRQSECRVYH